jgi:hypothetical protein
MRVKSQIIDCLYSTHAETSARRDATSSRHLAGANVGLGGELP